MSHDVLTGVLIRRVRGVRPEAMTDVVALTKLVRSVDMIRRWRRAVDGAMERETREIHSHGTIPLSSGGAGPRRHHWGSSGSISRRFGVASRREVADGRA